MPDKNDFSEIISELLRSQDRTNEILIRMDTRMERMEAGQERIITTFNTFATVMIDKLTSIETEIKDFRKEYSASLADHEQRLKRIEEVLFKR